MRPGSQPSVAWVETLGRRLRYAGALVLAGAVGLCPLLVGSVHRPAMTATLVALSLAFLSVVVGERLRRGSLRASRFSLCFLLLVLIPMAQTVPLPSSKRAALDPAGIALLENAPGGVPRTWPLSLDPVSTRNEIGIAAAALVVFLLSLHLAMGRRHRLLVLHAIAGAGLLAVASGIAHRIFGIDRLYGLFTVWGAVLPGPFINANHSAEFFELTAFVSLALAADAEAEAKVAWYVAAGMSAAMSLTTLSRGALLALFAGGGTLILLRLRGTGAGEAGGASSGLGRLGKTLLGSAVALGCLVTAALALGALPLWDEVSRTNLNGATEKVVVWKDCLPMILRHPWGIGRHAFDRVYPAYKTLALDLRFQFVENGPLQLIIDVGWLAFAALCVALFWTLRKVTWRRDDVGNALLAALVACAAHNLVDFGLETMGIRVPFAAIAGVAIGRSAGRNERDSRAGRTGAAWAVAAIVIATLGLSIGTWAQGQLTAAKLEERWKLAGQGRERKELAIEGGERFPTDFFFPLLQSYDEPLRGASSAGPSPKLVAINRALRLCPTCAFIHEQAAAALLRLGLRSQALSSFRDVVRLAPIRLPTVMATLTAHGFGPAELSTLAVGDGADLMTVARYLVPRKAAAEVAELLEQAERKGVPQIERSLVEAELAMAQGRLADARTKLLEASRIAPRDGRPSAGLASLAQQEGHLDLALDQARIASTLSPFVVDFARRRLTLVLSIHRWSELDDALERLKLALRQNGQSVAEVHMIAGQVHESRGNLERALSEFRTAAALDSVNPAVWAAVARVSEERGDLSGAVEAYQRGILLRPDDTSLHQAIARIEKERADARLRQLLR